MSRFTASPEKPIGALVILDQLTWTINNKGVLDLGMVISVDRWASVGFNSTGGNALAGFAFSDNMTKVPAAMPYNTSDVIFNTGAANISTTQRLGLYHDGSSITFLHNGTNLNSYAVAPVDYSHNFSWNTDFFFYVAAGLQGSGSTINPARINSFLIRSSVSRDNSSYAEVFPKYVSVNTTLTFTNYINPFFSSADNAGVDELTVTLPTGYSGLSIASVQADANNDGALETLTLAGSTPVSGKYALAVSGLKATIRLGTKIGFANSNKKIVVVLSATTPATTYVFGQEFVWTVEGKHDTDALSNGTCGPARLISGDVEASVPSDSIAVYVYGSPDVRVAIDPDSIGYDKVNSTFTYNVRNDTLVGNQGFTKLRIAIPTGFEVQNTSSLILTAAERALAIGVSNSYIWVDYGKVGKNVPAGGGTDIITFSVVDNFTNTLTAGPHVFSSQVDDAVAPVGWVTTGIQTGFTNAVMVTAVQASASAYVKPNTFYTSATNTDFTFYLVNNASGVNPISWAKITLPLGLGISHVTNIRSSITTNAGITLLASNEFVISYSNASKSLPTSSIDIITVRARDNYTAPVFDRKWSAIVDNGFGFGPHAQDAGLSINAIDSPYGSIKGRILPANVLSSITLYEGTNVRGTAVTDGVTGTYQILGLNATNASGQNIVYDIYAIGIGFAGAKYLTGLTLVPNGIVTAPDITMSQNPISGAYATPKTLYTAITNETFTITISANENGDYPVNWAEITVPGGFAVENVTNVKSSIIGSGTTGISLSTVGTNTVITINYATAAKTIPNGQTDTVTVAIRNDLHTPASRRWTIKTDNGFGFKPLVQDSGLGISISDSPYGIVSGTIYPLRSLANITIYSNGTETAVATFATDGVTGKYIIRDVAPGLYDVFVTAKDYAGKRYVTNITVSANRNTSVPAITLSAVALDSESGETQTRILNDDPATKVEIPSGALYRDAFVSLSKPATLLSPEQMTALANNRWIKPPSTTGTHSFIQLSLQDASGTAISNLQLKKEATLTIHYDQTAITAMGWTEANLSVFFWDGIRWIRIGGTVDAANDLVSVKIRNINGVYAVFEAVSTSGVIRNVTVTPNPFTPDQAGFATATLSFLLDKAYPVVDVRIFDLRGRLVRSYSIDGGLASGSVPWDGKDKDGYMVKSGIFIYQITAGGQTYSGRIVMIR